MIFQNLFKKKRIRKEKKERAAGNERNASYNHSMQCIVETYKIINQSYIITNPTFTNSPLHRDVTHTHKLFININHGHTSLFTYVRIK